jgi:hypothetical protein
MKNKLLLLSSCLILLSTSFAAELNYKWKANAFYAFNSVVTDNISTSVMGINVSEKYTTTVDFVLFIQSVDVLVKSMANGIATIDQTIATDKSADMFEGGASGETEEGSFNMGTFGGTSQMDLTAEDQEAIGMSKSMSPDMDGVLTTTFDYTNGMFVGVSGTINTNIDMMGMKMTVKSDITMKKK